MAEIYDKLPIVIIRGDDRGVSRGGSIKEVKVELDGVEDSFIVVEGGSSSAYYAHSEVAQLGGGDRRVGLTRLVENALYGEPGLAGQIRPFNDELR